LRNGHERAMARLIHRREKRISLRALGLTYVTFALACSGGSDESLRSTASDNPNNNGCRGENCEVIGRRVPAEPSKVCPSSKPEVSRGCEEEGVVCSYGSSLTAYCREVFECVGKVWTTPRYAMSTCVSQPEGFCPSEPVVGASCTVGEIDPHVACEYAHGVTCHCFGDPPGKSNVPGNWYCYGPPRNGSCPEILPNLGDGCARKGQFCGYGPVDQGCHAPYAHVYCRQGAWEVTGGTLCLD
jgi:hypothetical protein